MIDNFFKHLSHNFFKNLEGIFSRRNIPWHIFAIVITYLFVISKFDWFFFLSTRNANLQYFVWPAVVIGALLPIIGPIILLIIGKIKNNEQDKNVAFALGQAAILGWFISSLYKVFTGRVAPPMHTIHSQLVDISSTFHFGFFREGIFWGWPSSHTTTAFAMAFTLFYMYHHNRLIKLLAIIYSLYIGIGVSTNIHWFSDFVAGAIIGTIIGAVVAKHFHKKYNKKISRRNNTSLTE